MQSMKVLKINERSLFGILTLSSTLIKRFNWIKTYEFIVIKLLGFFSIYSKEWSSSVLIRFVVYSSTAATYRDRWEKTEVCNPILVPSATST